MRLLRSLPENAGLADLRTIYGELLDRLRPYAQRLMRGPLPFTLGERELIAANVSGVNACRYCHGSHSLVARGFGIDEGVCKNLMDDIDLAPVDPSLKPILCYVRKLTETPSRMTETDVDAVYDAGWTDEALLHAVAVSAYFNNMHRLVEGTGIVGTASRQPSGGSVRSRQFSASPERTLKKSGSQHVADIACGGCK